MTLVVYFLVRQRDNKVRLLTGIAGFSAFAKDIRMILFNRLSWLGFGNLVLVRLLILK